MQVQGPGGEGVSPRTIFELASDEEALALDHMACTLHVLNFARQGHGQRGLLALNLSPWALLAFAGGQEALFQAVLAACGLSPQRVVLEVTDHGFEDCTALAAAIAQCRAGATTPRSTTSAASPVISSASRRWPPTSSSSTAA